MMLAKSESMTVIARVHTIWFIWTAYFHVHEAHVKWVSQKEMPEWEHEPPVTRLCSSSNPNFCERHAKFSITFPFHTLPFLNLSLSLFQLHRNLCSNQASFLLALLRIWYLLPAASRVTSEFFARISRVLRSLAPARVSSLTPHTHITLQPDWNRTNSPLLSFPLALTKWFPLPRMFFLSFRWLIPSWLEIPIRHEKLWEKFLCTPVSPPVMSRGPSLRSMSIPPLALPWHPSLCTQ